MNGKEIEKSQEIKKVIANTIRKGESALAGTSEVFKLKKSEALLNLPKVSGVESTISMKRLFKKFDVVIQKLDHIFDEAKVSIARKLKEKMQLDQIINSMSTDQNSDIEPQQLKTYTKIKL